MQYYPLLLNLEGARCLVVGAGAVGRRKIEALLSCKPREILVLDLKVPSPFATESEADFLYHKAVHCEARAFTEEDLHGKALVFATTNCRETNARIAAACKERGIPCNVADAPEAGSFIVPAHFRSGDMLVALSTGGKSPALARQIKRDLEAWFGNRYEAIAAFLGRLRPEILQLGLPTAENTQIFRALVTSPLAELLHDKRNEEAEALLETLLPPALHSKIGELVHGRS